MQGKGLLLVVVNRVVISVLKHVVIVFFFKLVVIPDFSLSAVFIPDRAQFKPDLPLAPAGDGECIAGGGLAVVELCRGAVPHLRNADGTSIDEFPVIADIVQNLVAVLAQDIAADFKFLILDALTHVQIAVKLKGPNLRILAAHPEGHVLTGARLVSI